MTDDALIKHFVDHIRQNMAQMYITSNQRLIDYHYESMQRALNEIHSIADAL